MKSRLQRVIALFIILSVPTFILKEYQNLKVSRRKNIFSEVKPAQPVACLRDKEFVILIVSTAINEQFWERNLNSLLTQAYENYRVVYLDGGSSQRMLDRIEYSVAQNEKAELVTIIRKEEKRSLFEHYCDVVKNLADDAVVVHLDGNDWLAHDLVLQKLNSAYSCQGVWLTYGGYLEYTPGKAVSSIEAFQQQVSGQRRSSSVPWFRSPLKTYYAKLFKQLDFSAIYQEDQALTGSSWGFMLPMVQMAGRHVHYIPEVLYVHNTI
ncbi:MAG: hypothetical protein SNF33_04175 [Candidatus Algichlamydia australiensis]|nr:hypothetical protein [Chlamydiales bacterium]